MPGDDPRLDINSNYGKMQHERLLKETVKAFAASLRDIANQVEALPEGCENRPWKLGTRFLLVERNLRELVKNSRILAAEYLFLSLTNPRL